MSRERVLRFVAPSLLVVVALLQIYLAHARALSPWRGGGFGMFASTDSPGNRFLRCTVDGRTVAVPPHLRHEATRALAAPSPEVLGRIADGLDGREVRVEVWRCRFDSDRAVIEPEKILEVRRP